MASPFSPALPVSGGPFSLALAGSAKADLPAPISRERKKMNLEQRVREIEARNSRVEAEKAWETSLTRRLLLMVFTYLGLSVYFWAIDVKDPWLNGIVPAAAFAISMSSMPFFRGR